MANFNRFSEENRSFYLKKRPNETKLGENITTTVSAETRFALVGIPESVGVRANGGVGGTETAWESFLHAFLNIQATEKLSGSELIIYGSFDFSSFGKSNDVEILRQEVQQIDTAVSLLISEILHQNLVPIVIGGGHNNAFPIIRAVSQFFQKAIGVINIDAHSDYRTTEGRHSGNGFRYAFTDDFLEKYAVIGLHENYNSPAILKDLKKDNHLFFMYEDIFIHEKIQFSEAISASLDYINQLPLGFEIDLDAIENTLSSAITPCGISPLQARKAIYQVVSSQKSVYFHCCEAAAILENGQKNNSIGKLLSYFTSDFVKAY
jgi:formiminoglutamase